MPDPQNPKVTLSVDLLAPEGYGEITGGGQRIHVLEQLLDRIKEERIESGRLQVVYGASPLRNGSTLRLWDGRRENCSVGLRP